MANGQRDKKLETRWRRLLRRQATNGMSVRQFCRVEGVSEASFYAWRRTIAQRDRQQNGAINSENKPLCQRKSKPANFPHEINAQPPFVPITLDARMLDDRLTEIVIELRGGRRLQIPESIEPQRLAQIVHAIEAEPTE